MPHHAFAYTHTLTFSITWVNSRILWFWNAEKCVSMPKNNNDEYVKYCIVIALNDNARFQSLSKGKWKKSHGKLNMSIWTANNGCSRKYIYAHVHIGYWYKAIWCHSHIDRFTSFNIYLHTLNGRIKFPIGHFLIEKCILFSWLSFHFPFLFPLCISSRYAMHTKWFYFYGKIFRTTKVNTNTKVKVNEKCTNNQKI